MTLPKHQDPTDRDRIARAPYNFVPLPEKAVQTPDDFLAQDRYYPDQQRHTGRLDCTLTTWSPLYTRGAVALQHYGEQAAKNLAGFFVNPTTQEPTIPGSSLRGMLRTLVEIVCAGKMGSVTKRKLFFRTMDDSNVGTHYSEQMGGDRLRGGILRIVDDSYWIEPCIVGRVERDQLVTLFNLTRWVELYEYSKQSKEPEKDPNMKPSWHYQYRTVWVELQRTAHQELGRFQSVLTVSNQLSQQARHEATLVLTGNMQHKLKEFVLIRADAPKVDVDEEIIRRFHDDDQLTQWQEKAFPQGKPNGSLRRKDGALRDGEPVFYLLDDLDQVLFLGRAAHFRLPYSHSPYDMTAKSLRDDGFADVAEAIFGYVDLEIDRPARGSRVFVTDGVLAGSSDDIWHKEIIPGVLSSPKPTSIQLYLTQTKPNIAKQLAHYDSIPNVETSLRGYKLYWHKGDQPIEKIEADPVRASKYPTQYTRITPIRSGVQFRFTIHFDNLSSKELGAVLWVLRFAADDKYRLKLGMGKPLGMGSVKIESILRLTDRDQRYSTLFVPNGDWNEGFIPSEMVEQKATSEFEQFILGNILLNPNRSAKQLEKTPMVSTLLTLLSWPGPSPEDTEYMTELRWDFAKRKVLPNAATVAQTVARPQDYAARPDQAQVRRPTQPHQQQRPPVRSDQSQRPNISSSTKSPTAPEVRRETGPATKPRSESRPPQVAGTLLPELSHPTSASQVTEGMYLEGRVVGVEATRVVVDIGVGEEASLPVAKIEPLIQDEYDLEARFPIGAVIRAWVSGRNKKGRIQLSVRRPA